MIIVIMLTGNNKNNMKGKHEYKERATMMIMRRIHTTTTINTTIRRHMMMEITTVTIITTIVLNHTYIHTCGYHTIPGAGQHADNPECTGPACVALVESKCKRAQQHARSCLFNSSSGQFEPVAVRDRCRCKAWSRSLCSMLSCGKSDLWLSCCSRLIAEQIVPKVHAEDMGHRAPSQGGHPGTEVFQVAFGAP